ncbi:MAG: hypothetical protein COA84_13945 [Robiginitomaculum sp.]|nr:MAG: hypothetical protein COA84_13945 [Robiginitomaculum sp.]
MNIFDIIEELNADNGANYKLDVLRKHKDNELLQRVLKMTYDSCTFTYGVTMKNVTYNESCYVEDWSLTQAMDSLENNFVTRKFTGNAALSAIARILSGLTVNECEVFKKIITRDLRINMGRSQINKVFKNLIVKPVYMRCGTYNDKSKKKFAPLASYIELKADGTYREFQVSNGKVACQSRSGEDYNYPDINEKLLSKPDGVHFGECTVYRDGILLPRGEGNGILMKSELPEDCMVAFDTWDFVTLEEYNRVATRDDNNKKQKGLTPFHIRRKRVKSFFPSYLANPLFNPVRHIESHPVCSASEALTYVAAWMEAGLEGGVWKERGGMFMDGTSAQQLKLKLEIDVEVRVTGFKEGTVGTAREATFGSMTFTTDDGKIQGAVSGFSNPQLIDFNSRREEIIGKIMTVTCNDITQARGNTFWALSHPRFIEFRSDRDDTDTFERAQGSKEMAMMVGDI